LPKLMAFDIASTLKARIFSGEWTNGRVPPERELAAEFGVARNTVRRAFEFLEKDGTVVRHVGRGTFLASGDAASLSNVVDRMQGASPADMMEIRQLLEPAAASFAATNASAGELEAVRAAHMAACEALEMPDFERCDAELHHRIFACSRNEFLKEIHNLMRIVRNQAPWFEMKRRYFSQERRQVYCGEHGAIVGALLRRDPAGARLAMTAHLETVGRNLLGR
jgi:GntR family transcriptional regulator, hexuronate regulon transcriptional repressor